MDERIEFLRALMSESASLLGVDDPWCNMEGVMAFFRDHGMGAPGTWVSVVNAGVLEAVERGIAIAADRSDDTYGNAGATAWARYLTRRRFDELTTQRAHDAAWSEAKDISTDSGVAMAERQGLEPTIVERRFLRFARFYTWVLSNRPAFEMLVLYGGLLDSRLAGLRFVDGFVNVRDPIATRQACEMAYAIAQIEPPDTTSTLESIFSQLAPLFGDGVGPSGRFQG